MKKQNKKAFTLVELIVVITILAILGTIAFISLQGYSKQARDSRRIADISNIKTSLEIFALQKGNYPSPDNGQLITYSGDTVWTQGIIGDNVTTNLSRNLSKKPTDPLFETEYIYSVTYSGKEYELLSIHEGDLSHRYFPYQGDSASYACSDDYQGDRTSIAQSGNSLLGTNVYAASSYNTKIDGNYNQIFVITQNYIIPTPSIINSSLDGVGGILNDTTIDSQIITNGNNSPNIGNSVELLTGGLDIVLSATGLINENSTIAEKESVIVAIQTAYSNSPLSSNPIYSRILNTSDAETLAEELILNTPSGTSETSEDSTPTYSCDETTKPTDNGHISFTEGTPTEEDQAYVQDALNCGYSCSDGYTGIDCNTEPPTWQDEDSNCLIATDVTVTGTDISGNPITQIWAPCNSTLGTGIEYSVDEGCYNYIGGSTSGCNRSSNELESVYNATYGIDNIWGKLYVWSEASKTDGTGPCPNGRSLPTQEQWAILIKNLGCGSYVDDTTTGWICDGLGWASHIGSGKDETNNLVNALKVPLSGNRNSDGSTFNNRGLNMNFWSSSEYDSTSSKGILLNRNFSTLRLEYRGKTSAFSVRCIKD